jgi:hypothetical protein
LSKKALEKGLNYFTQGYIAVWKKNNKIIKDLYTQLYRYSTILKVCHRRFRHEGCVDLDFFSLTANILHPRASKILILWI